jgi:hypothetical protein
MVGWEPAPGAHPAAYSHAMAETITVQERGRMIAFSFDDMLRYAGPHSPGGVAHAFKALQRAIAVLSPGAPPQRRSIVVRTPFQGPGARDGFEAVTRAVTDGRYTVDTALVRRDLGRLRESFVFEVCIGDRTATLLLRDGFVTEEFIDLAGQDGRTDAEESRLDELKAQLAQRVMTAAAEDVYDVAN